MDNYIFYIPFTEFFSHTDRAFAIDEQYFRLQKHTWTALIGPSGLGKTTFMRYLAFSGQKNQQTQKKIASTSSTSTSSELMGERARYLPKDSLSILTPHDRLLPWLSVEQNIGLYDLLKKKPICQKKIHNLLCHMRLPLSVANAFPHTLSTGMAKRILLARTLYCQRPLLFLDEPFSNLDDTTKWDILTSLKESSLCETVFFITHDQKEAHFADRIYSLTFEKKSGPLRLTLSTKTKDINPQQSGEESDFTPYTEASRYA